VDSEFGSVKFVSYAVNLIQRLQVRANVRPRYAEPSLRFVDAPGIVKAPFEKPPALRAAPNPVRLKPRNVVRLGSLARRPRGDMPEAFDMKNHFRRLAARSDFIVLSFLRS
jgi:hypothetical protein